MMDQVLQVVLDYYVNVNTIVSGKQLSIQSVANIYGNLNSVQHFQDILRDIKLNRTIAERRGLEVPSLPEELCEAINNLSLLEEEVPPEYRK
jgi:hypothetical protein